jgi:hypothetical protein
MDGIGILFWRWLSQPRYLLVEIALLAALLLAGWLRPAWGEACLNRLGRWGYRAARRPVWASMAMAGLVIALRLAMLPFFPVPEPHVHDEFSYLLAADTFAHFRLANPVHPMWRHLESPHIFHQPAYSSMYPPGQGMLLAAGKLILHPWVGVLASAAALPVALFYMLRGWIPGRWALLGALLAIPRWILYSYWINSYWGGALPAIGGALVLGAMGRLWNGTRAWRAQGVLLGCGAAILMNTRPFEGGVLVAAAMAALLTRIRWRIWPAAAVLIPVALWMGYFHWRTTGNPLLLPYEHQKSIYGMAKAFAFLEPGPRQHYGDPHLAAFYQWELDTHLARRNRPALTTLINLGVVARFLFGPALGVALLGLPWAIRSRKNRVLVWLAAVCVAALAVETWMHPHYAAPAGGLAMLLVIESLRRVRVCVRKAVLSACAVMALFPVPAIVAGWKFEPSYGAWWTIEWDVERPRVIRQLEAAPGNDLVIVRHPDGQSDPEQWVYNEADIDRASIVWARERDAVSNEALIRYFKDRRVWLLVARRGRVELLPQPARHLGNRTHTAGQ